MLPMTCAIVKSIALTNAEMQQTNAINISANTAALPIEQPTKSVTNSAQGTALLPIEQPSQRSPKKRSYSIANNAGVPLSKTIPNCSAQASVEKSTMPARLENMQNATTPQLSSSARNAGVNLSGGMGTNGGSFVGCIVPTDGPNVSMVEPSISALEKHCENSMASLRRKFTKSSSRSRFMNVTTGNARSVGSPLINKRNLVNRLVHLSITLFHWQVAELTLMPMFKRLILNVTGERARRKTRGHRDLWPVKVVDRLGGQTIATAI